MGIFKKLGDLARANLNHFIGQLEDPKKLADQAVLDLGESKRKAQRVLGSVIHALNTAQAQIETLPKSVASLTEKAEEFLRNSDEAKAVDALRRKQEIEFRMKTLSNEIAENVKAKASLERGIKAIDDKISSLKSSSSVNASLNEVHKDDAFSTFARMEEKIEAKEHEVLALNELISDLEKKDKQTKTHSASFDKHSDPEALDHELDAIKKKLKP